MIPTMAMLTHSILASGEMRGSTVGAMIDVALRRSEGDTMGIWYEGAGGSSCVGSPAVHRPLDTASFSPLSSAAAPATSSSAARSCARRAWMSSSPKRLMSHSPKRMGLAMSFYSATYSSRSRKRSAALW